MRTNRYSFVTNFKLEPILDTSPLPTIDDPQCRKNQKLGYSLFRKSERTENIDTSRSDLRTANDNTSNNYPKSLE